MAEDSRSGSWWQTLPGILTGAATLVTAIGGVLVVINKFVHQDGPPTVAVVRVIDLSPDAARAELERLGLRVGTTQMVPASTASEGKVTQQDPAPGAQVAKGSVVNLTVGSAAAPKALVEVPPLVTLTLHAARSKLQQAGLRVGRAEFVQASPNARGRVTDQFPTAGTKVPSKTVVALQVGADAPVEPTPAPNASPAPSPTDALVEVPRVTDLGARQAKDVLEHFDLRLGALEPVTTRDASAMGKVLRQQPLAGDQVPRGTAVTLYLGRLEPQQPPSVRVPWLVNLSASDAQAALERSGLAVGTRTYVQSRPGLAGKVTGQVPAEGALVAQGTAVNLSIGRIAVIPVSSNVSAKVASGKVTIPPIASLGSVAVPRLTNLTVSEARAALETRSLRLGPIQSVETAPNLAGRIARQDPPEGRVVAKGTGVKLYVGRVVSATRID